MALFKVLRIAVFWVFVGALAFSAWFGDILTSERPIIPTRVSYIPFEAHGGTTYISATDQRLYDGSWTLIWIAVLVHAAFYFLEGATLKAGYRKSTPES